MKKAKKRGKTKLQKSKKKRIIKIFPIFFYSSYQYKLERKPSTLFLYMTSAARLLYAQRWKEKYRMGSEINGASPVVKLTVLLNLIKFLTIKRISYEYSYFRMFISILF